MQNFIQIITNNYKNIIKSNHAFKEYKVINNVLFFKEIKDEINKGTMDKNDFKNFSVCTTKILTTEKAYDRLKKLTLNEIEFGTNKKKAIEFFNDLETKGLDSFAPNKIMTGGLINMQFANTYNTLKDTILSNSQRTCLNGGVSLMLEYFNSCTFMPFDVFSKINDNYTNLKVYQTTNDNNNLNNVYLLSDNKTGITNVNPNKLPFLSKIVSISIYSLAELFNQKNNVKLDLVLYAANAKKQFPKNKNDIIDETNVNSGDTIPEDMSLYRPMIRMYRAEEMIKVLIHETVHGTHFETNFGESPKHKFKVLNVKSNSSTLLFNETITETFAEFINCVLYSLIHNKDTSDILKKEIDFGFLQTAKILDHFEFKSIEDFTESNDDRQIKQKTATFEYHILKSVLLYKFNDFLEILLGKSNNKTKDLMKLISETMTNDTNYKNKVNEHIKNLSKLEPEIKKTFRMSTTEIYNLDSIPIESKQIMTGGNVSYKHKYYKYKQKYIELKIASRKI